MDNIIIHTSQGEYFSYDSGIYIEHHGILGQKWGVRRYQNKDGSLTAAGKKRKNSEVSKYKTSKLQNEFNKANRKNGNANTNKLLEQIWKGDGKYSSHLKKMNKLLDESYGTALKDLGFEDTQAGREYLKSHNFNTGLWYTPEREIYDYDD